MAITISGSAQTFTTLSTGTIVVPGTVSAGDLLILQAVGGWAPSVPGGWTSEYVFAGANIGSFVAYKTAIAGDIGATISVVWSGGFNSVLNLIAVAGGSGLRTPARHMWSSSGGTGTPGSQPVATNDMVLYMGGNRSDGGAPTLSRGSVDRIAADGSIVAAGVIGHELMTSFTGISCTFTAPSSGSGFEYSVLVVSGGGSIPIPAYYASVLLDSPLAYWKLDETAGATQFADSSGNIRPATISGTPIYDNLSYVETSSVKLDGTQYGYIFAPAWFSSMSSFTAEGWFKVSSSVNRGIIVGIDNAANALTAADRLFRLYVRGSGEVMFFINNSSGTYVEFGSVVTYLDNFWHHAAATFDGTTVSIYVDGVFKASQLLSGATATGAGSWLLIGSGQIGSTGNAQQFTGNLDEVALYGSVLSDQHIYDHYVAGSWSHPSVWLLQG